MMRTFRLLALSTVLVAVASCGSTGAQVGNGPSGAVTPTTTMPADSIPLDPPVNEMTAQELDAAYPPGCWVGRTVFYDLYVTAERRQTEHESAYVDIHPDGTVETNIGSDHTTTCRDGVLFPDAETERRNEEERQQAIADGIDLTDGGITQRGGEMAMNIASGYAFIRIRNEYDGRL
jgi:hypothetical protein